MKNALLFLNVNRRINILDYIAKLVPLKNNINKYDKVFCIMTDTQNLEDNMAVNNIKNNIIQNISVLLNLIDINKVVIIKESDCDIIFSNSNKISNYIYLSKILKSDIISRDFQPSSLSTIKISNIFNIINYISEIFTFNIQDIYADKNFDEILNLASKFKEKYDINNSNKITLPNLVVSSTKGRLIGLDGNKRISSSFNNNIDIFMSDDEIYKKVISIYTDPNHIKINDKGNVKDNPLFDYVRNFCDDEIVKKYFDFDSEQELEKKYELGGIGDYKIKKMLYEAIIKIVKKLRKQIDYSVIENLLKQSKLDLNIKTKKL